ncbi:Prefoldin alpha subunit, partial [Pterulicium gracile]
QQQVNITDLSVAQLAQVKKQLEDELTHLTNSFAQLKAAQTKFNGCIDNITEVKPESKGKTILVPLTASLYVPGKLTNPEHVIVDVGTGYYIQKTRPQALKYYRGKVDYLKKSIEGLQETIQKKQDNVQYIVSVLQNKIGQEAGASGNS